MIWHKVMDWPEINYSKTIKQLVIKNSEKWYLKSNLCILQRENVVNYFYLSSGIVLIVLKGQVRK